ncbi:MAG TPA: NADP-dependent oxidoreductase [Gaiellaceae bacterium]|nr:NADP-dependent oxidoreductase [Gaiellaceae bacterium]
MAVRVATNRAVTLAARPTGFPSESDFALVEQPVPEPAPGEVLVRVLWTSVDPYQRGRMSTARSYARPVELGEVMTAQALGEVAESKDGRFEAGDLVVGQLGWQEYAVSRAGALRKIPSVLDPPTLALHAVGGTGFTAYFGLLDVGQPKPGDTVVVSGAAGAVGQIVGQLAKLAGCRAVGISGGPDKMRDLTEVYGYDAAIDYKNDDLRAALKAACPGGVDVYFDNVGGEISAAVHARLALHARIVICGQVSTYNAEGPAPTFDPRALIVFRASMKGFLVNDYAHRFDEAGMRLAHWIAKGTIRWREHVTDGLENAPAAFIGMLNGDNRGKALVRVASRD